VGGLKAATARQKAALFLIIKNHRHRGGGKSSKPKSQRWFNMGLHTRVKSSLAYRVFINDTKTHYKHTILTEIFKGF